MSSLLSQGNVGGEKTDRNTMANTYFLDPFEKDCCSQSHFGDKPLEFQAVCPLHGTVVFRRRVNP